MTSTLRRFQVTPSDVGPTQRISRHQSSLLSTVYLQLYFLLLQVRLPQVRSESYLLVCAEGVELSAWRRNCYSELS